MGLDMYQSQIYSLGVRPQAVIATLQYIESLGGGTTNWKSI